MENALNLSSVARTAPPTPSKWDIIPIHTSDRSVFKNCRRAWGWGSPSKRNLIPKTRIAGIREALWFGTGIHYALEKYYQPRLKEDPVVTWESWFHLQWEGGLVTEEEISEHGFHDREPVRYVNDPESKNLLYEILPDAQYFVVKGLNELLPNPDEEHFAELRDLGRGMMKFYKTYAEDEDNFSVISTEHNFSIPILEPDGSPMYRIDTRQMPEGWEPNFDEGNEYGPLMREVSDRGGIFVIEKQVHARGRSDIVIQDNESGRFGIIDHKTANRIDEDYFRHIVLDEQCTTYMWALEQEARMHDLEFKQIDFVIYQALLKGYPKPPTITSRGLPSIDRQKETTTAAMFEQLINSSPVLREYYESDVKMQSYYTWLLNEGDTRFINRHHVHRNTAQKANLGTRLFYEAEDMLSPNLVLYHNPRKDYTCLNCIFRSPCIAAEDGSDYQMMLEDGFMPNWDR